MDRAEIQAFVRKHRKPSPGFLERKLWDIAEKAPLGGIYIGPETDPYLLRIYVSPRDAQFKWLWRALTLYAPNIGEFDVTLARGVPHLYLHHFFRGDADVEVHNHPWLFSMSLILTDGYLEERWDPIAKKLVSRDYYPGDINVIRSTDFHRVTLKQPGRGCWTLFLSSNRVEEKNGHDWGFLDTKTEKYTPWAEFIKGKRPPEG